MKKSCVVLTILIFSLMIAVISGCGGGDEPTPVPTATKVPLPTDTDVPTATPLPPTDEPATSTPTKAPSDTPTATALPATPTTEEAACDNIATFVNDVTIPDGMPVAAGTNFVKTWRIRNIGTCTWTTAYTAVFVEGEKLGDTEAISLSEEVTPDEVVDISVSLTAPKEPGTYRSHWKLQSGDEEIFGTGPDKDKSFWVEIVVPAMDAATPTATE